MGLLTPILWTSLGLTTLSCSSTVATQAHTSLLGDYITAKKQLDSSDEKGCATFKKLAGTASFSLKDIAYVKALDSCSHDNFPIESQRNLPRWLKKYQHRAKHSRLATEVEKAAYIYTNKKYFFSYEEISAYQKALKEKGISKEQTQTFTKELYSIAPRFNPTPPASDTFRIVKDLYSIRSYDKARKLLNSILKDPKRSLSDKFRAHKNIFYSYKVQRNQKKAQFLKSAETWSLFYKDKVLKTPSSLPYYYEAQINYLRTIWTYVGWEKALSIAKTTEKKLKGHTSLHKLYWLKGRIYEERKNYNQAFKELKLALKETPKDWAEKERTLWTTAWLKYKTGNYKDAVTYLKDLINSTKISPYARFKYQYWLGASYKALKQSDDAKDTWEHLTDIDPIGYYGLIAHSQLKKQLREITASKALESDFDLLSKEEAQTLRDLIHVDETSFALRLLNEKAPLKESLSMSNDDLVKLFRLYARLEGYKKIFHIFNSLKHEQQKELFEKVPQTLFPQAYKDQILLASQKAHLEPAVIYSIIRQESAFDPKARSPMDAFGLMQVLPELAKKMSRKFSIPYSNYSDLYDPVTNISIGSHIIKRQIERYDNKFVLFIASYNSSDRAVRQWLGRHQGTDSILFVENIPYEETRTYVKLVLRNFVHYRKIKFGTRFQYFPAHLMDVR